MSLLRRRVLCWAYVVAKATTYKDFRVLIPSSQFGIFGHCDVAAEAAIRKD
jgi:hypothetical protein